MQKIKMDRRDFLKTTAALAAGLPLASEGKSETVRTGMKPTPELNPNTQWLREARWGVFTHYLVHMPSAPVPEDMTPARWNDWVDSFDAKSLADQFASVGVPYFFIWVGPKNGKLSFEIDNPGPGNTLAIVAMTNEWIGYTGRQKDIYTAVVNLEKIGIVSISLNVSDFKNAGGKAMSDWDQITEINFRAADKAQPDNPSLSPWKGKVPTLHNLRWEGGIYTKRPKIHESQKDFDAFYGSFEFNREYQQAIKDSVQFEKELNQ